MGRGTGMVTIQEEKPGEDISVKTIPKTVKEIHTTISQFSNTSTNKNFRQKSLFLLFFRKSITGEMTVCDIQFTKFKTFLPTETMLCPLQLYSIPLLAP